MAYVGWRGDKGVKDLQRLCDDKHRTSASPAQVLKKPVYEILFAEDARTTTFMICGARRYGLLPKA